MQVTMSVSNVQKWSYLFITGKYELHFIVDCEDIISNYLGLNNSTNSAQIATRNFHIF